MVVFKLFGVNIVANADACNQKATSIDSTISGDEKPPSGCDDEDVSVSFESDHSDADVTNVYNPKPLRCFHPDFPIIDEFGGLVDTTNEASTSTVDVQEIERNERSKRKRNNEDVGQGKKKRTRVLLGSNHDIAAAAAAAPEPPSVEECFPGLVQRITESPNGTVPELLYTKVLQISDVCKQQNRLLICKQGQRKFSGFFTPNEATAIEHTREGAQVVVILPRRQNSYNLRLKRWNGSKIMILNSGWSKLVSECNAEMDDVVQIWGFRENANLSLAINFVKNQKSPSSDGASTSKVT